MDFIPMKSGPSFPDDPAQLQADMMEYQRRQQLAQAMLSAGYTPNSGRMGVLTSVLGALAGGMLQRQNNESVTDLLRRSFEQQQKAEEAKRAQELADEERGVLNKIREARGKAQADREFATPEFTGGGVFDRSTGKFTASPEWMQQQLGLKQAEARIAAANREAPNAGLMAKIQLARSLGASDDQIRAMVTGQGAPDTQIVGQSIVDKRTGKATPITNPDGTPLAAAPAPLTAEARNKLSLIDNALANARKFQERVVGKDGSFKDIESMTGDTPQLIKSAIQDMLYAKSGASAPVEEVKKAEAMYGPERFMGVPLERDTTASAKVGNFINDLQRMRDEIGGVSPPASSGGSGGSAAQPTVTAVNPQTGQRIGLVNGQWVPL